jgi:hypothetical protein
MLYSNDMDLPRYVTLATSNHTRYEFLSVGIKGAIKKAVNYIEVAPGIYNLGFGDLNEATHEIKDTTRSNNGDRDKVLATVASTVIDFMKQYPDAIIYAAGETPVKTRLYQMGINSNWHEINQLFTIKGYAKGVWEPFTQKKNYDAFTLTAKEISKFEQ